MAAKFIVSSVLILGLLAYVLTLAGCGAEAVEDAPLNSQTQFAASDFVGPGYGGVKACIPCHAERVASYQQTSHFQTLRVPDPEVFAERIAAAGGTIATRDPALTLQMSVVDDQVLQSSRLQLAARTWSRSEVVAFIMGSGRIFEGYFYWADDALMQLPLGYSELDDSWHNCPGYPSDQAVFDRGIKPRCLDCHGTWAESLGGARYRPSSIMPGISCERCHGPGQEHVLHHQAHPDETLGQKIVKPAELNRERRLDICSQCHSEPGELLQPAFHYLPGTDLKAYLKQTSGLGSDVFVHTANQVQRLKSSTCFQASDTLDCLSCHETHSPEGDRIKTRSLRTCAGCHEPEHCGAATDLPAGLRSDCLSCHMPLRQVSDTTINTATEDYLDFFRMTEHRIGRFELESELVRGRFEIAAGDEARGRERIRAVALKLQGLAVEKEKAHRFVEAMALLREAGRLVPDLEPSSSRLQGLADREGLAAESRDLLTAARELAQKAEWSEARTRTLAVLALAPGQPEALTLLAELELRLGRPSVEVEKLVREALQSRGDYAEAKSLLVELLLGRGANLLAVAASESLVEENPQLATAHQRLGQARAAAGDLAGALQALETCYAIDANQPKVLLNLAALRIELGDVATAKDELMLVTQAETPGLVLDALEILIRIGASDLGAALTERLIDHRDVGDRARVLLAELAVAAEDSERALALTENLGPGATTARALAVQAGILRLRRDLAGAEATLRRAVLLEDPSGRVSRECLRLLATARVHDQRQVAELVSHVLASELRQVPRALVEVAELAVSMGAEAAAEAVLSTARERPEWQLSPDLIERGKALQRRLDAKPANE